jgi:hypothetical protein
MKYNLQGMLIPFNPFTNKPIFLEASGQYLLPIFSTQEQYDAASKWAGFEFAKQKPISDPQDFINSVVTTQKEFKFLVAADPYINSDGNTTFELIKLEEPDMTAVPNENS